MTGNRLGWAIAALIGVVFVAIGWQLAGINRLTPPTRLLTETAAQQPFTLDVPLTAIYRSDQPGDSGAAYRKAVEELRRDSAAYATYESADSADAFSLTPLADTLRTAAKMIGDAGLTTDAAIRAGYEPADEDLDARLQLGRLLGHMGTLGLRDTSDVARPWFEAEFAIGAKLFEGRVRLAEASAGIALVSDAAAGLRELAERAGDSRRAALLATFGRAAGGLANQRLAPLADAMATVDGGRIAEHAGDVYTLAGRDTADRSVRIEAILALGRHQFNAERDADRLVVARRLDDLENGENDAFVLAAIHAARGLTIEAYRTLR